MKIKWLYTFLSLLTLLLLAGSSAFIFYDGSTSIEIQRSDNQGHLKINKLFINFVSNYKALVNSSYISATQFNVRKKEFIKSLEQLEQQAQKSTLIQVDEFRNLSEKLGELSLKKIKLQYKSDRLARESDLAWRSFDEVMAQEVTGRVNRSEEFLPEFKKKLSSWSESIGLLSKLRDSIDISYVKGDKFQEIQELIDLSRWLIKFKNENLMDLRKLKGLNEQKKLVYRRIQQLNSSTKLKRKLQERVTGIFVTLSQHKKVMDELHQVNRNLESYRLTSSQLFEKEVFPKWQEYISERYDQRITQRYKRLKKVVTAVSLGGGLIILTMLFVFLKIFPNLKKLEEKAKQVAAGSYEARFDQKIPDSEIGNVMHAFNEMSVKISLYLKELEKKESEKLQLNESIQRIRRLSQLGEFSAKMSHELKNPISILNFCLSDAIDAVNESKTDMAKIELEKCLKALERIKITASKLGAKSNYSKKEEINISELFDEIEKMYRALLLKENIKLNVKNNLSNSVICAPRLELTGALSNLIDNALEHIRLSELTNRLIEISLFNEADELVVTIANGGSEIENPGTIFKAFHSTKDRELRGLGLIIVKDVIDECGGVISYSYKNKLNTFEIRIPLV